MSNQLVLTSVGEMILLTAAKEMGKQFEEYLRGTGLTDEDIRLLDKQGALFYWSIIMDNYIAGKLRDSSYYLYDMTIFIGKLTLESINDEALKEDMKKFVEQQSIGKAKHIRQVIGNSVSAESINYLFEKMTAMLTQGKIQDSSDSKRC